MSNQINAFIFDLDGVITDTAEYHFNAWSELAKDIGIEIDEEFNEQLKGVSRIESLQRILKHGGKENEFTEQEIIELADKKNDHYKTLIAKVTPNDILPGIVDLLEDIKASGIQIALGSASKNAPFILEQLQLNRYFDYIVDAGKVKQGKPHPETFLTAADHFDVPYETCVGVEDAEAGVTAIKDASMFAVGVGSEPILHKANIIFPETKNLSLEKIKSAFNAES
ncbi:beta-phosphoglucomutase [Bacillus shivajii]|uniref:beta-phosphoglucomutase n=1 Tax=Bacillus shivajii TaxID=1983719 RepID=UPI001CFA8951|nr:beta-phosphoglucomutase [Bacillus shivajii]UCZ52478.1 beta-phosphoglucomutase [Bacillus shivajii]